MRVAKAVRNIDVFNVDRDLRRDDDQLVTSAICDQMLNMVVYSFVVGFARKNV
jgi:hypothetical protein